MAMRYLIRREKAEDFSDIKSQISDLEQKLGTADEGLRRDLKVRFDDHSTAMYQFLPRKTGGGWQWVCPTIELLAKDEPGLFALTSKFGVPIPQHLAHLSGAAK